MNPAQSASVAIGVDILNASRETSTAATLLQIGDVISGQVESDRVESWQHAGFCSIPANPIAGQSACQAIVFKRGDIDVCIATRDTRAQTIAANLGPGETCTYAGGHDGNSQGRTLWKDDGSITQYTTDTNTSQDKGGRAVYFRVARGVNPLTGLPDGFSCIAPWGSQKFDGTGFHVLHASGASFDLGGLYGMPAPLDQISSYFRVQAGTVNLQASSVSMGVGPVFPLANATAVLAALSALSTALTALIPLIVTGVTGAGPGGASTGPALASSAAPVLVAMSAALAAQALLTNSVASASL
jgi:hypothetical protein